MPRTWSGPGWERPARAEAARTERAWGALAKGFRARTQQRVDAVRRAAAELFAIPLPQMRVPSMDAEQERFFYLFIDFGGFNEPFVRLAGRVVPGRIARRRALTRARAKLVGEFDKHAGRARWDLTQRLDGVRRAYEVVMRVELDATIDSILGAARRAEELSRAAESEPRRHALDADRQRRLAERLAGLGEEPG